MPACCLAFLELGPSRLPVMLAGAAQPAGRAILTLVLVASMMLRRPRTVAVGRVSRGCRQCAVPPQLFRSRLTCDGGGATTAGGWQRQLRTDVVSRRGAETGGATTSTVCVNGTRELAKSRCVSRGAGAITVGASEFALRILSRETFGVGGTIAAFNVCNDGEFRVLVLETSGAGSNDVCAASYLPRALD